MAPKIPDEDRKETEKTYVSVQILPCYETE